LTFPSDRNVSYGGAPLLSECFRGRIPSGVGWRSNEMSGFLADIPNQSPPRIAAHFDAAEARATAQPDSSSWVSQRDSHSRTAQARGV